MAPEVHIYLKVHDIVDVEILTLLNEEAEGAEESQQWMEKNEPFYPSREIQI